MTHTNTQHDAIRLYTVTECDPELGGPADAVAPWSTAYRSFAAAADAIREAIASYLVDILEHDEEDAQMASSEALWVDIGEGRWEMHEEYSDKHFHVTECTLA